MISYDDMKKIMKALPKGFVHRYFPSSWAFNELPGNILWNLCPPDSDYIKRSRGFLKRRETVGEFDCAYDQIYLYDEFFKKLQPIFSEALKKLGLKVEIVKGNDTRTYKEFRQRLSCFR